MLDEKLKDEEDLLENYQGSWILLYFTCDGKTFNGMGEYDSEQSASGAAENTFIAWSKETIDRAPTKLRIRAGGYRNYTGVGRILYENVSHAIPIPTKGE